MREFSTDCPFFHIQSPRVKKNSRTRTLLSCPVSSHRDCTHKPVCQPSKQPSESKLSSILFSARNSRIPQTRYCGHRHNYTKSPTRGNDSPTHSHSRFALENLDLPTGRKSRNSRNWHTTSEPVPANNLFHHKSTYKTQY